MQVNEESSSSTGFKLKLLSFPLASACILSLWLPRPPVLPITCFVTLVSETQRHDLLGTPTVTSLPAPTVSPIAQAYLMGWGSGWTLGVTLVELWEREERSSVRAVAGWMAGGQQRAVHASCQGHAETQIPFSCLCQHSSPGTLKPSNTATQSQKRSMPIPHERASVPASPQGEGLSFLGRGRNPKC